jgi:glycine cleavage system H lipoate-binding protein
MVVILVATLFAAFVTIDLLHERRRRRVLAREGQMLHDRVHEREPQWVAGYELPEDMHYHQGHTWVHWVSPEQAYVGIDDFARRLLGKVEKVKAPPVGAWLTQGEGAIEMHKGDAEAELVSPLSGEVVAINPRLRSDASVVHRDSYGHGWLFKIRSPHLLEQLGNLLHGRLAQRWVEDVRDRFQHELMLATGSVIQDGGTTVDDLSEHLDPDEWQRLVDEFLVPSHEAR